MWIPTSVQELENTVRSGSLEETEIFDAKKELTTKSLEIAKDIAAMANEGGVLIYGIDEDQQKRPTILNPIPLAGTRERINSIVQTSIAEPPRVVISTLATDADPSVGYLIVAVPPSERAPHMVVVKGDHRFYGRTATGNIPLTEGQVAQLYERRRRWEVDHTIMLGTEVARSPYPVNANFAYLHLIARPVARDESLLEKALRQGETKQRLIFDLASDVTAEDVFGGSYHPDFYGQASWRLRADGVFGGMCMPSDVTRADAPADTLDLQVDFDGSGHLFCGRAAERTDGQLQFFDTLVAGNTTRFLTLLGRLYARARYLGMVDIGVAITGLAGSVLYTKSALASATATPYDRNEYRRTGRVSALDLKDDARGVARQLLMPLIDAMSQGRSNPFK